MSSHPFRRMGRLTAFVAHIFLGLLLEILLRISQGPQWHARPLGMRTYHWWMRSACRIMGLRIRVEGTPANTPMLLVANHISWLDIPAIAAVAPTNFVAKDTVRSWPVIGTLAAWSGTVFLDRNRNRAINGALAGLINALRSGKRIVIFPEGTTTDGSEVKKFHSALFETATQAQCPVQAVAIQYLRDGKLDNVAPFIGDDSFVPHLLRVFDVTYTEVLLTFCPVIDHQSDRRYLSEATRTQISSIITPAQLEKAA